MYVRIKILKKIMNQRMSKLELVKFSPDCFCWADKISADLHLLSKEISQPGQNTALGRSKKTFQ
jgi:hypothetical protein